MDRLWPPHDDLTRAVPRALAGRRPTSAHFAEPGWSSAASDGHLQPASPSCRRRIQGGLDSNRTTGTAIRARTPHAVSTPTVLWPIRSCAAKDASHDARGPRHAPGPVSHDAGVSRRAPGTTSAVSRLEVINARCLDTTSSGRHAPEPRRRRARRAPGRWMLALTSLSDSCLAFHRLHNDWRSAARPRGSAKRAPRALSAATSELCGVH